LAGQIIRLASGVPYSNVVDIVGTITDDPVQYYVFGVSTNAERAQFEILSPSGDANLYVRKNLPVPTPATAALHSINPGSSPELISLLDTSAPVPLTPGDWFIAVYNNTTNAVSYAVQATEFFSRGTNVAVLRAFLSSNSFCITWTNTLPGVNYYVVGKPTWTSQVWMPVSDTIRATSTSLTWCTPLPTPYAFFDLRQGLSPFSLQYSVTLTNRFFNTNGLTLCWTGPPN